MCKHIGLLLFLLALPAHWQEATPPSLRAEVTPTGASAHAGEGVALSSDRSLPPPIPAPAARPDTLTLSVALGYLEYDRWFVDTTYQGKPLTKSSRNSPYVGLRAAYTIPTKSPWRLQVGADFTLLFREGIPNSPSWNSRKSDDRIGLGASVMLWHEDYPRRSLRFYHLSDQALSTNRQVGGFGGLERPNWWEINCRVQ